MDAMHFTKNERIFLLDLAKKAIASFLEHKTLVKSNIPKNLLKNAATFVTLHKNSKLRGCIGSLTATRPLYKDVISNAINAAFFDPRFNPITKDELSNISIEISLLSKPKKLKYKTNEELLKKLKTNYGIIIKKGYNTATFLPQVWQEIKSKEEFLSHLCIKADLPSNAWKTNELSVYYYKVFLIQ